MEKLRNITNIIEQWRRKMNFSRGALITKASQYSCTVTWRHAVVMGGLPSLTFHFVDGSYMYIKVSSVQEFS